MTAVMTHMAKGRLTAIMAAAMMAVGTAGYPVPRAAAESEQAAPSDLHGHWAEREAASMMSEGLIAGYPDGRFRPDEAITRAEFLRLAVTTARPPLPEREPAFLDVPAEHWAAPYAAAALRAGIIRRSECPEGLLRPGQSISRSEMAVSAARALKLQEAENPLPYPDIAGLPEAGLISAAARIGLVTGFADGAYRPNDPATRAQAAVLITRMRLYLALGTTGVERERAKGPAGDGTVLLDRHFLEAGRLYGTGVYLGMAKKEVADRYGAPLSKGSGEGDYTLDYPGILQGRTVTLHFSYDFDRVEEEVVGAYSVDLGLCRDAVLSRLGGPADEGTDAAGGGYFLHYAYDVYDVFFRSSGADGAGPFSMKVTGKG
ncbi:S-layer homology domain-containing protein [Paenibacillus sp. KR2-11]|uniref:S-layer homology domain-containing protein n=1 Tax=Paenibacillus sp. KR2-11 TaxID=3385500 RepID=UPI0038FD0CC0